MAAICGWVHYTFCAYDNIIKQFQMSTWTSFNAQKYLIFIILLRPGVKTHCFSLGNNYNMYKSKEPVSHIYFNFFHQ